MHYSVHKTKNRPLDLFDTDCINPNSVAIGPSLYEIFVFSFFLRIVASWTFIQHISIFQSSKWKFKFTDPNQKKNSWTYFNNSSK